MATDSRIDRLEVSVEGLQHEVRTLRSEMNTRLNSLEGRVTTMWVTTVGTMVAGFITLFVAILITR
jgi:hypothetical protein